MTECHKHGGNNEGNPKLDPSALNQGSDGIWVYFLRFIYTG